MVPQPDFTPDFIAQVEADGLLVDRKNSRNESSGPSIQVLSGRKRRGLVTRERYGEGYIVIAEPPENIRVGTSRRSSYQQPRHRKLSADQIKAIQQRPHHTLRELAAEYGVSHETIRAARRATT